MKYIILLLTIFAFNSAYADVNKCIDPKGKITFTDKVCKHGQNAGTVKIKPINIIDSSADKRAMQQVRQNEYEQALANRRKAAKYASDRYYAHVYYQSIKQQNAQRMNKMNFYYPSTSTSSTTSKRCYYSSSQSKFHCY